MVKAGFYLLSLLMFASVWYMIQISSKSEKADKKRPLRTYIIWFVIWVFYLIILDGFNVINSFELPPRIPLFIILPVMVSIFLFHRTVHFGKHILSNTPPTFALYIQGFRVLVELLIYGAFLNGILPKQVTFEGTNFDVVAGATAPLVGFLYGRNLISNKIALIWNIAAISILGFTVYTFLSTLYFGGPIDPDFQRFGDMPYLLLPGILLPCAIFYHVVSIRQLTQRPG